MRVGKNLFFKVMNYLKNRQLLNWLKDDVYLKIFYEYRFSRKLHLDNPKLYTEKLQWLKLYDRRDIYTDMVDKYNSKKIILSIVGQNHCVKNYGVWDKFDDIDFNALPDSFVLKCTHDSGGFCIVDGKNNMNIDEIKKKMNKSLKHNYFFQGREWPYKNVKPRIIAEELLRNKDGSEVVEYNFFCFNGIPKLVMICHGDKRVKRYNDFYDMNFNKLHLKCEYDNSNNIDKKPEQFNNMIQMAKKLSKNVPQLRVDFYLCNDRIYVGELTFFHWGGFAKFEPEIWDKKMGDWLCLPSKKRD